MVSPPNNNTLYEIGPGLSAITALITGKGFEYTALFMGNYSSGYVNDSKFVCFLIRKSVFL